MSVVTIFQPFSPLPSLFQLFFILFYSIYIVMHPFFLSPLSYLISCLSSYFCRFLLSLLYLLAYLPLILFYLYRYSSIFQPFLSPFYLILFHVCLHHISTFFSSLFCISQLSLPPLLFSLSLSIAITVRSLHSCLYCLSSISLFHSPALLTSCYTHLRTSHRV